MFTCCLYIYIYIYVLGREGTVTRSVLRPSPSPGVTGFQTGSGQNGVIPEVRRSSIISVHGDMYGMRGKLYGICGTSVFPSPSPCARREKGFRYVSALFSPGSVVTANLHSTCCFCYVLGEWAASAKTAQRDVKLLAREISRRTAR